MKNIGELIDVEAGKHQLQGNRVTVGVSTCGISAGAQPTLEKIQKADPAYLVDPVGCAGMCYNEPIVTVQTENDFYVYALAREEHAEKIISSLSERKPVEELLVASSLGEIDFYAKQKRLIMENCGKTNPQSIEQYAASGGFKGLGNALKTTPKNVIQQIKDAKLRGRGGAGFPTAVKWEFLAEKQGLKYLVCNGDEGDPGAFMNRTLLESDPFRVLEGMIIAAYATGCEKAFIYTRTEYPLAISTAQKAIKTLYEKKLLGEDILGVEGFTLDIKVMEGAGAFVCGEETALMNSVEGKRGYPMPRPPYPAQKGLWGHPTNINNVGTLAHVTTIMSKGAEYYAQFGSVKSRGTKIICLAGKINRPGVIEVPIGTPLKDIVYDIGGGVPEDTQLKGVQSGGPAGGCIPARLMDTPLDYETLQELGAIMGSGGLVVLNNQDCMVDVARYFMNFTRQESCGKCTPCREGTTRLLELLEKITNGAATKQDLRKIKKLSNFVVECSLCGLGQNAPNPILSTMNYFWGEYEKHVNEKTCEAGVCRNMINYKITEECVGCGNCARVCPVSAISGQLKEKHEINQKKCIKCGQCYENCAFSAIEKNA
ncbi:MAG: 4Fe-4S dicluster domain-containing protein [Candidatus Altiarchaeales archaeon]|nr:4Fe-4S dicluster domain-containing protein [Candidatus Altiarchaeales archaeon]